MVGHKNVLVWVHDGRYDVFGTPSLRTERLTRLLSRLGGVSDEVEDGYYVFNAKWRWNGLQVSLDPFQPMVEKS